MTLNPEYKAPQQIEQPFQFTKEQAEKVESQKFDYPTEILELPILLTKLVSCADKYS